MSANNEKTCRKVQYTGFKTKVSNTNFFSTSFKNASQKTLCNLSCKLTSNLHYNQFRIEYYYFPALAYYLRHWEIPYTIEKKAVHIIVTVSGNDILKALNFSAYVKGGASC